jgi:hypothetical protein
MATDIDGATVSVQLDLGESPFILDRDLLDADSSVLTPTADAMSDVSCEIIGGQWSRGAPAANGILTDVVTGRAELLLSDPDRTLDPLNDTSAANTAIGAAGRVLVDGTPAFSGYLSEVSHDMAAATSTVVLLDGLSLLHQQAVALTLAAAGTWAQATQLLDAIGWPPELRVTYGAPTSARLSDEVVMSAFEVLTRLREAELGDLWVDGAGRLALRARGYPRSDVPRAVIGCDGIALETITAERRRIGLVNHVVLDMTDPAPDRIVFDSESIAANGRRSYTGREADLLLS